MNIASELEEVQCDSLPPGSVVEVETQSRQYRIEFLNGDQVRISGHPVFCPQPVLAKIHGSLARDGDFKPDVIGSGMRLMFRGLGDRVVTTSEVLSVRVLSGAGRSAR